MLLEVLSGVCFVSMFVTYLQFQSHEKKMDDKFDCMREINRDNYDILIKKIDRSSELQADRLNDLAYHLYIGDDKNYEARLKKNISNRFRAGLWMYDDIVIDETRDPSKSVPIKEIMYKGTDK